MSIAKEGDLRVYVEYIGKSKVLRPMEVKVQNVYNDHVVVVDLVDNKIKRLNFSGIFRIGIEDR